MITAEVFEKATGYKPEQDDLERCNCPKQGQPGHLQCGWDTVRNMPFFIPGESKVSSVRQEISCGTPSN